MNLFVVLFFIGPGAVAFGGGTTVGDGGHIVICGSKAEVLDIYERRILVGPSEINFGNENMTLQQMKDVGLARVRARFKLTNQEFEKVATAATMLLNSPVDPWVDESDPLTYFLQTKSISIEQAVYNSIKQNYCEIDIVAIKPPKELPQKIHDIYDNICAKKHLAREDCFFVSQAAFSWLTKKQKACLAIHESLRYLPANISFVDERSMRRAVAEICTNN